MTSDGSPAGLAGARGGAWIGAAFLRGPADDLAKLNSFQHHRFHSLAETILQLTEFPGEVQAAVDLYRESVTGMHGGMATIFSQHPSVPTLTKGPDSAGRQAR